MMEFIPLEKNHTALPQPFHCVQTWPEVNNPPEPNPVGTLSSDFQNDEKYTSAVYKPPIHGILLQQPQCTETTQGLENGLEIENRALIPFQVRKAHSIRKHFPISYTHLKFILFLKWQVPLERR